MGVGLLDAVLRVNHTMLMRGMTVLGGRDEVKTLRGLYGMKAGLHGFVVWILLLPTLGAFLGAFAGQLLSASLLPMFASIGFFAGAMLAIQVGMKPGAYKPFFLVILGAVLAGFRGATIGGIIAIALIYRSELAVLVTRIWERLR
jgi:hypothetical protein